MVEKVAVRAVITRDNPKSGRREVAFVQRPHWSKLERHKQSLPGGKQEDGENEKEAIARELREELGIPTEFDFSELFEFGRYYNDEWVTVAFLLKLAKADDVTFILDDKSQDAISWLEVTDGLVVTEYFDPNTNELIHKVTIAFDHAQMVLDAFKKDSQ